MLFFGYLYKFGNSKWADAHLYCLLKVAVIGNSILHIV
jgi:hypothetical protein